jgi:DNA-dependent protein kinase catalytic subunit
LSIRTYQVIPITTKLALIEWIPETKTLKEAIYSSRDDEEAQLLDSHDKGIAYRYQCYIENASKDMASKNVTDLYGMVFAKYSSNYVTKSFKELESLVPWDLLRRHIRSMSISTDGYFHLRNQFIMSYAVACACQYILGIGDRHLGNSMIETKTGKSVAIDFGMAFGHSTINLAVPELIPIRLTRQILKLIAPLEQYGLFEATMLHTIRALRENNDLLMCILDVFIKEPNVDWYISHMIMRFYKIKY